MKVKIIILVLSIFVLLFNALSLVALLRTRNTPKGARFMSSALLIFDFFSTLMYTVRKFVVDARYNLMCQFVALGCSYSAYINIAIMTCERLAFFEWPMFYLRHVKPSWIKSVCCTVWFIYLVVWCHECIRCYLEVDPQNSKSLLCFENVIISHALVIFSITTFVSCCILSRIIFIIRKQQSKFSEVRKSLKVYKSTACVLFCCSNYLVTTVSCMFLAFVVKQNHVRRIVIDIVLTVNGFVDTCVYVLWYKECRYKIMQMLAKVFPSLNNKAENMRISVFQIMTYADEKCKP